MIAAALAACLAAPARGGEVGVVSHVKVLSDKVEDVSSLAAWRASWIKPQMSDEDKALAIWKTVVKYRHQTSPPNEFLEQANNVHDVMKTVHVYGYGMCCCAASNIEQLGRYVGLRARGRIIHAHSVPELFYGGRWHLLDASLINYFRAADDGHIASVNEIIAAVRAWHEANPGYRRNAGKLRQFARGGGWKKGPALLAKTQFYSKNGWNMAGTHGWPSTMQEYDCPPDKIFEYGYSQGYRLNVQLRRGERLTRNWFNKGLHVNRGTGKAPGCLGKRAGMGCQRKLGDIAPGRVGNGVREWDVPLDGGAFREGALSVENLGWGAEDEPMPKVFVKNASKPAALVVRMPSSYVYLTGELRLSAAVAPGGAVAVHFSGNNGLDWRQIARLTASGEHTVDLTPHVLRRYDYRLKLELSGAGTGLNAMRIRHDVQHSQAPLPALGPGENTITFAAGPAEGTITIEGRVAAERKHGEPLIGDFHPELKGVKPHLLRVADYKPAGGSATFAIETPGEMARLRLGAHWRARDKREGWRMLVSFDGGRTFREVASMPGPMVASCTYVTVDDVPPGTQKALARFQSTRQRNTLCIFDLRIDADYREPFGGCRAVKITYVWREGNQEKTHVHVARRPKETYRITCNQRPLMRSLIVELADAAER